MTAVCVSCGLQEIGGGAGAEDEVWNGPGSSVAGPGQGSGKKVWYAVGVDYPAGYDWISDVEKGSVRCSLVVFANGVPMLKIPVGDDHEISADPDMHRMIGGSLYTDFSTSDRTVVKKDGKFLFEYPAREAIVDAAAAGDDLYTLGQSRTGKGFAFRRNGEVLLERSSGYAFPDVFPCESGGYAFAFCETVDSQKEPVERYYLYADGKVSQVAVREDIRKVWDVVLHDGKVCCVATLTGITGPVLIAGDEMTVLEMPVSSRMEGCRFVCGERLYIEGLVSPKGKAMYSVLWEGANIVKAFGPGYAVSGVGAWGDALSCVLNSPMRLMDGIIYRCGESIKMPRGYMSMGGKTLEMIDGILYVGLTSTDGDGAAVWIDGDMKPLKINGFISNMSSGQSSQLTVRD